MIGDVLANDRRREVWPEDRGNTLSPEAGLRREAPADTSGRWRRACRDFQAVRLARLRTWKPRAPIATTQARAVPEFARQNRRVFPTRGNRGAATSGRQMPLASEAAGT